MRTLLFICFFHLYSLGFAQSAWDIEYFWIDSINNRHSGMLMVIDFAPQNSFTKHEPTIVRERQNILREDTVKVQLNGKLRSLIENRTIHADWGLVSEQSIEILTDDPEIIKRVVETRVQEVTSDSINFEFTSEYIKKKGRKERVMSKEVKRYWIRRVNIDGLLVPKKHPIK